jgi:hypothetical protein
MAGSRLVVNKKEQGVTKHGLEDQWLPDREPAGQPDRQPVAGLLDDRLGQTPDVRAKMY